MSKSQDIDQVPIEDLTPEEASRIIHSHRKVRYGMPPRLLSLLPCSPDIASLFSQNQPMPAAVVMHMLPYKCLR
jgi:hypothetical protein